MTIEQKIDETPTAAARGPAGKIAEFLADIEPFFYRVPITYVDVGAHHGDIFRELAASGLHLHEAHLVEPSPTAFAALEATARGLDAPGTRCHRLALAEAPGRLTLREQGTTTQVVGPAAGAAGAAAAPGAEAGTFEVESTTLDALARTFAAPRISLLKIDVEGYEPQVLAGAAGLLAARAIDMIYVEAGMNPDGRQQAYYRDIEDLLRGHGYRLFRIYEQMHEWLDDSPLLRRVNLAFMSADFAQRHPFRLSRELAALRRDRAGLRAALKAEQAARGAAEAGLAEAAAAAARQAASLEARFAELAALTGLLERQKAELAAATAARGTAEAALAAAEAAAATARGNAEAGRAARRKAEVEARRRAEAERAEASAARRQAEAARAEASAGRRRAEAERAEAAAARRRAEADLSGLRAYARSLEAKHLAMLESETWRAMEPVRRLLRLARGKKPPPPFAPRLLAGDKTGSRTAPDPVRLAQEAEVRRYVQHLWGGLSGPAVNELTRILEDPAYAPSCRFDAAHKLATWHAFAGDPARAKATLAAIDAAAPEQAGDKERLLKEGFVRLKLGDKAGARTVFERLLQSRDGRGRTDAVLALANCLGDDRARLAQINKVYAGTGLAPLEPIDKARPLGIDNVTARPEPCRDPGLGKVSVIVPAYKAEATIATALRSLLAQSYRDLEIIVVDDRSPDGTRDVVAGLAAEDPRIRLLQAAENGGPYAARNLGLAHATGAFVTTHDADDWSHPQKIEQQMAWLARNPAVMGVCTYWVRVFADFTISSNWRIGDQTVHWSHSSFLFRREIVERIGSWDPVRVGGDTEYIWRLQSAYGKAAFRIIGRKLPLAFALDDEGSLTRAKPTHVRTIHYGLRQIYRALAQHSHATGADRLALAPAALTGGAEAVSALDFLLMGDCTNAAVVAEMQAFAADVAGGRPGRTVGVFHWPDFASEGGELGPDYCRLLAAPGVRPVLPGARIRLASRLGVFFGHDHREVDMPPEILPPETEAGPAADAAPDPVPETGGGRR